MKNLVGLVKVLVFFLVILVTKDVYAVPKTDVPQKTVLPGKEMVAYLPDILSEENSDDMLTIWADGSYSMRLKEDEIFESGIQKLSSKMKENGWPNNKELFFVFNEPGSEYNAPFYYFIWTDYTYSIYDERSRKFILHSDVSLEDDIKWKERGWPSGRKVAHIFPSFEAPEESLIFVWDDDNISILPHDGPFEHLDKTISESYKIIGWPQEKKLDNVFYSFSGPVHLLVWDDKSYSHYRNNWGRLSVESDVYLGDQKRYERMGWPRDIEVKDIKINSSKPASQEIYANGKMQAQLDVWVKFTRPDPDKEWNDIPVCINDLSKQVTLYDKHLSINGEGAIIGYSDDSREALGQALGLSYSQHWIKHEYRNEYDSFISSYQSESVSPHSMSNCANDGWSRAQVYITSTETEVDKHICVLIGGISSCDDWDEYAKVTAILAPIRSIDDFRVARTKLWGNSQCHWCEAYRWELIPNRNFRVVADETGHVNCRKNYISQLGVFSESWRALVLQIDGVATAFLSYPVRYGVIGGASDRIRYWSLDHDKWIYKKNPRIDTNNGRINFLELKGIRKYKGGSSFEGSHPDQCMANNFQNYSWLSEELKYRDNFGNEIIMSLGVDAKGWYTLDGVR